MKVIPVHYVYPINTSIIRLANLEKQFKYWVFIRDMIHKILENLTRKLTLKSLILLGLQLEGAPTYNKFLSRSKTSAFRTTIDGGAKNPVGGGV